MLFDIIRFNHFSPDLLLPSNQTPEISIGEYLRREGYSDAFVNNYLIPMTAAIWSTAPDKCALEFPAKALVRFLWNHRLLNAVWERPRWFTIGGGAKRYVDAVTEGFPEENMHLEREVTYVGSEEDGRVRVVAKDKGGEVSSWGQFDHVVLATHGDQALRILGDEATFDERELLSHFRCEKNRAVLHSDISVSPHLSSSPDVTPAETKEL